MTFLFLAENFSSGILDEKKSVFEWKYFDKTMEG